MLFRSRAIIVAPDPTLPLAVLLAISYSINLSSALFEEPYAPLLVLTSKVSANKVFPKLSNYYCL